MKKTFQRPLSLLLLTLFFLLKVVPLWSQEGIEEVEEVEGVYCPRNKDIWKLDMSQLVENYFKKNPQEDLAAFAREYPYSIKFCGLSRNHIRPGVDLYGIKKGMATGHGVFFLKGAAIDKTSEHPRLRTCPPEELKNGESGTEGVGISINIPFKNANWLAFPKKFFFDGDLTENSVLDKEQFEKLLDKAGEYYKPVEFHDRKYWPPGKVDPRRTSYARMLGSDYGLSLNRVSYCLNVPLNETIMKDIVHFLNGTNESCSNHDSNYFWNPFKNNCVHLGANLAADLGIAAKNRPTHKNYLWQLGHMTIPANFIIDIAYHTLNQDIDPQAIFEKDEKRQSFMKYNWLPVHHGNLMEIIPATKLKENQIFESDPKILAASKKFTNPYTDNVPGRSLFKNFFNEKQYIKRKEAAAHFKDKYESALVALEKMKETLEADYRKLKNKMGGKGPKGTSKYKSKFEELQIKLREFTPFYDKFKEYLQNQLAQVENILKES